MEVQVIKAGSKKDGTETCSNKRLRVAAYCRVSTNDEEQAKSYNSMIAYYTEKIDKNPEWENAGIYADQAVTGTKTDKREGFNRLISDCMAGKIDLVLTKSIPRFARNTMDTIKYVRLLSDKGIAIQFETESINTMKDGEFILTLLSSVAQQEVTNTSANVTKGLKMKMSRGEIVGFAGCLGYDYDVQTKQLTINPEEAETVRYIFDRYITGMGGTIIARELNERGIKTFRGNNWDCSGVLGIVKNEKYVGDLLLGKTFTKDPISKKRLKNEGEQDQFYIKDHHEPIIDRDTFLKAQEIRCRRGENRKNGSATSQRTKISRMYAFSSKLVCGFCGAMLSRRHWHSSTKYSVINWQCSNFTKRGKSTCCDAKAIPENVVEAFFVEVYNRLAKIDPEAIEEFLVLAREAMQSVDLQDLIKKSNSRIQSISRNRTKLLKIYLDDSISKEYFEEKDKEFNEDLIKEKEHLQELQQENLKSELLETRIGEFRKVLSELKTIGEFNREVFDILVEKVIVGGIDENGNKDPYQLIFIFNNGLETRILDSKRKYRDSTKKNHDKDLPLLSSEDIEFDVDKSCDTHMLRHACF